VRRIVGRVEQLLGGEAYHWHAKMILKEPASAGPGHGIKIMGMVPQQACLEPIGECWIAIDPATRENGSLPEGAAPARTSLAASISKTGDPTGADRERVKGLKTIERALHRGPTEATRFLHCKLLHRSIRTDQRPGGWGGMVADLLLQTRPQQPL